MAARITSEQEVRDDRLQDPGLECPSMGTVRAFRNCGADAVDGWVLVLVVSGLSQPGHEWLDAEPVRQLVLRPSGPARRRHAPSRISPDPLRPQPSGFIPPYSRSAPSEQHGLQC